MALLEVQLLESEVRLHNACCLYASSQHILLGGDVICFSYPLQIVQVTKREAEIYQHDLYTHTHTHLLHFPEQLDSSRYEACSDVLLFHLTLHEQSNH